MTSNWVNRFPGRLIATGWNSGAPFSRYFAGIVKYPVRCLTCNSNGLG